MGTNFYLVSEIIWDFLANLASWRYKYAPAHCQQDSASDNDSPAEACAPDAQFSLIQTLAKSMAAP